MPVLLAAMLIWAFLGLTLAGCGSLNTTPETCQASPSPVPTGVTPSATPSQAAASTESVQTTTMTETTVTIDTREPSRQLKVRDIFANIYEAPHRSAPILACVAWLEEVGYIDGPDLLGFSLVQTKDGVRGYCVQSQLADPKATLYANVPEMTALSVIPGYAGPELTSRLVDVRQADPSICIDLIFASDRNFTGQKQYERDICLLQQGTMTKLMKAQKLFNKDGFSIKIYDAYRPYSVTVQLATYLSNPIYLADPARGSMHNKGAAIDITVVNLKGVELEMPSLMHTLDASASCWNPLMTPEARRNLDYVQGIMIQCGFVPYAHEWWHFSDSENFLYPHLDMSLADVRMVEAEKAPKVKAPPVLDPVKSGTVSVSPTPSPSPSPTPEMTEDELSETAAGD